MGIELTPELIDQIIFGMENQNEYFYLNLEKGSVEPERNVPDELRTNEERYVRIPRWGSADGFHLMEKFVDSLRNPVFRERLREALASGKGVFRNFKNILKERDDIQRLWFQFKEREMRSQVVEWYNQLCEAMGFAQIGPEPEETEELVLSDFVIETGGAELEERLDELDLAAFQEACGKQPGELQHLLYLARRSLIPREGENQILLQALTPAGENAGFVWGVDAWLSTRTAAVFQEEPAVSFLLQLYVQPEFRGLGLARLLLDTYVRRAYQREMKRVVLDLWGGSQSMQRLLETTGFETVRSSYLIDLDEWAKQDSV